MTTLSDMQARTLAAIVRFEDDWGQSPTFQEIRDALGHSSCSTAHKGVTELRGLGMVRDDQPGRPRGCGSTPRGRRWVVKYG